MRVLYAGPRDVFDLVFQVADGVTDLLNWRDGYLFEDVRNFDMIACYTSKEDGSRLATDNFMLQGFAIGNNTCRIVHAVEKNGWDAAFLVHEGCLCVIGNEEHIVQFFQETLKVQSPIEWRFFATATRENLWLAPQFQIGRYFADFRIKFSRVVIEIDGHEYHKTKEQRTHDAARERAIKEAGWEVIRFTGSEVFKAPGDCVEQAKRLAIQMDPGYREWIEQREAHATA